MILWPRRSAGTVPHDSLARHISERCGYPMRTMIVQQRAESRTGSSMTSLVTCPISGRCSSVTPIGFCTHLIRAHHSLSPPFLLSTHCHCCAAGSPLSHSGAVSSPHCPMYINWSSGTSGGRQYLAGHPCLYPIGVCALPCPGLLFVVRLRIATRPLFCKIGSSKRTHLQRCGLFGSDATTTPGSKTLCTF